MADNAPTGIARKLQESFRDFLRESADLFAQYGFLGDCERQLRELEAGIVRPFNVALVGSVKRGKSSIVNALLGHDLAITGLEETTATINVIAHTTDSSLCDKFRVHWKDRPPETFPLARLAAEWSGKTEKLLEKVGRTFFIQLFSDDPMLSLHEIIDTPGLGAAVKEHEQVSQAFLDPSIREGRKADALVYVFGPNAKEDDVRNLLKFREGCLPHSSPYNSVGVLHTWDYIYWNANGDWSEVQSKVDRTKAQMSSVVADVIPVSAPIAMIAARASSDDLAAVLELIAKKGARSVEALLQEEEDWNDDADCVALRGRKQLSVPWICFRVAVREAIRLGENASVDALRSRLRDLGGIERLRSFLDRHFFKSSALIRQRQQYARFFRIKEEVDSRILDRQEELETDLEHWDDLSGQSHESRSLAAWIGKKRNGAKSELEALAGLDAKLLVDSGVGKILKDLDALDWCAAHPDRVSEKELAALQAMADCLSGDESIRIDTEALDAIKNRFTRLKFAAIDDIGSDLVGHLEDRIEEALQRN